MLVTCSGRRKRANTILSGADGGLDSDIRDVKVEPIGYYDLSLKYDVSFGLMFLNPGKLFEISNSKLFNFDGFP